MKFKLFILIVTLSIFGKSEAQMNWEFKYFVMELGMNHGFSPSPDTLKNLFAQTSAGDIPLYPEKNVEYTPGFTFGMQFHNDFANDKFGIVVGAAYSSYSTAARYSSSDKSVRIKETMRTSSLEFPVFFKLSREMYNNQAYFYIGAQCNLNIGFKTVQKLEDQSEKLTIKGDRAALQRVTIPFFVGFNYKLFNMRFILSPKNFLNKDYTQSLESAISKVEVKPYSTQPDCLFYIRTSMTIPFSQWTTRRVYFLNKLF